MDGIRCPSNTLGIPWIVVTTNDFIHIHISNLGRMQRQEINKKLNLRQVDS
jgi:hypothetical protein